MTGTPRNFTVNLRVLGGVSHKNGANRTTQQGMNMKKGFTLIELLMVIALIAIVSTLAVNKLGGVRESSARKVSFASQKSVGRAVEAFLAAGGRLNRLDSLVYAQSGGAPIFNSHAGDFDFSGGYASSTVPEGLGTDWLYSGPKEDDPDGAYRDTRNAGLMPDLRRVLCPYSLSEAEVRALDTTMGLRYVMAHTAYADAAASSYPAAHYPKARTYGDGTVPNASDGLDPNDSACVATILTNSMVVAAVNPMTDLGRTIYQACGQELMNTLNWGQSYDETKVRAEVAAAGGPLVAFGLGESASIVGKSDAGLENAPRATFANKKFYSRYILLLRLKKVGSGSVSKAIPEFAGVLDCKGNTLRAAEHIIKRL